MLRYDPTKKFPTSFGLTTLLNSQFSNNNSKATIKNRKIMSKKNGRRKSVNEEEENAKALQEMIEKLHERQNLESDRQEKWNEAWERKLIKDEQCEDLKACCAPDEYFPAPRVQANIWLRVRHDLKNTQRIQMAFMNVPIPKPPPPPLPKLPPPVEQPKEEKAEKIGGKNNKKKKK